MSTTTETASKSSAKEPAEANPTGTPTVTLVAKNERRRPLFTSSYPVIMLIALAILLGVTYLSLITGRYPVELDELFRILGKNWFGMDLKVYKPAENMLLTVRIPRLLENQSTLMLVLSGVIVGGFGTAALGALKFIANPETQLAQIVFWQMGSLQDVRAEALAQFALVAVPCILLLLAMRWRINILSLGDDEARTLGINLTRTRGITILLATLVTATSVCIGGPISWVGLVIPHLCRLLVGSDTTKLMPLSILMGASFMMFVDTLARSLTSAEVPLSVLTGFIGTPLYVALLLLGKVRVK